MARNIGNKIVRAVTNALRERDRVEMRAMDAVLSLVESPRRNVRGDQRCRQTAATRRTRTLHPVRTGSKKTGEHSRPR